MLFRLISILIVSLLTIACSGPEGQDLTPLPTDVPTAVPKPIDTPIFVSTPTFTPVPTSTAAPTPTPTPVVDRSVPPDRDLLAMTQRLVLKSQEPIPHVVNLGPVTYKEGRVDQFYVTDIAVRQVHQVMATLHMVSGHAYWYVDNSSSFQMEDLEQSVKVFEERIYPMITRIFGTELMPGVDNDVHLTILHTPLKGAAGYYSTMDEYSTLVHPFSNQREMIYIDTSGLPLNSRSYLGTLAHELTHAIQFRADPTEDTWINEGLAELGRELAGYTSPFHSSFLDTPSVSLTVWPHGGESTKPYYGGASLFMDYLAQHYGIESMRFLLEEPTNGIKGIDSYLAYVGERKGFEEVFADWVVANYLDDPLGDIYSYPDSTVQSAVSETLEVPGKVSDDLHQYSARYYDLRFQDPEITVNFKGEAVTPLFATEPPGGICWWSNRGDSIDTTLTLRFVLPALDSLTLTYSLWYDIEEGWDFAYVEVSIDGGATWDVLEGEYTSVDNPLGTAFGPGYTGSSGGWLEDRVDLTPYGGQDVLLRFEYVTDETVHGPGLCLADITIPQIRVLDTDEADGEVLMWDALGFILTANRVPQAYVLRVIELGDKPRVRDIRLDHDQAATFTIGGAGSQVDHAIVVVAAMADYTMIAARFQLEAFV